MTLVFLPLKLPKLQPILVGILQTARDRIQHHSGNLQVVADLTLVVQ